VDDSKFMRTLISDILNSDPEIEVIGEAANGVEAIEKVKLLKPDVVTMDIEMPKMDGLTAVSEIMKLPSPPAIVMLSAHTHEGADATLEALRRGAVDFMPKPSGTISPDIKKKGLELIEKVKAATKAKIVAPKKKAIKEKRKVSPVGKLIIIGASTGGPPVIEEIMSNLPVSAQFRVVIVQHMPKGFTERFARRLDAVSEYIVREAKDGDILRRGLALVAPGDYHLVLEGANNEIVARLNKDKPINGVRPSVEPTLISASRVGGPDTIAVILTGMGKDGQVGVQFIKKAGGKVIAQSEKSCVVFGMPKRAIETGCVDVIADSSEIVDAILKLAGAS